MNKVPSAARCTAFPSRNPSPLRALQATQAARSRGQAHNDAQHPGQLLSPSSPASRSISRSTFTTLASRLQPVQPTSKIRAAENESIRLPLAPSYSRPQRASAKKPLTGNEAAARELRPLQAATQSGRDARESEVRSPRVRGCGGSSESWGAT